MDESKTKHRRRTLDQQAPTVRTMDLVTKVLGVSCTVFWKLLAL